MRLLQILLFLPLLTSVLACTKDLKKEKLIGIWESFETHHPINVLTFYQDSLILDGYTGEFHTNSEWNLDDEKIYLKNVRFGDTILKDTMSYEYNLNATKDTLYLKVVGGKKEDYTTMKKVFKNPFH
ncbi:hypothetical protein [Leeuwenhoekiella sp.]|uniref:hypothetical protein n=1 Tax=Leeuwenhoekiella sp. TaxID=1977054 RepID=UPI000C4D630D|nr:hypothetical protein [Leeuwenhoekiella sp.]MAW96562.1 hypothetical protein [Leeuwenhoekiella sp.]MBA81450.1 hypothetical protein [Leeuwenhoekiella sp.]